MTADSVNINVAAKDIKFCEKKPRHESDTLIEFFADLWYHIRLGAFSSL